MAVGCLWSGDETLAIFCGKVGAGVRKLGFDRSGVRPYYSVMREVALKFLSVITSERENLQNNRCIRLVL